jgi:hypothetical protein
MKEGLFTKIALFLIFLLLLGIFISRLLFKNSFESCFSKCNQVLKEAGPIGCWSSCKGKDN